jgi:hypothetical protein
VEVSLARILSHARRVDFLDRSVPIISPKLVYASETSTAPTMELSRTEKLRPVLDRV